MKNIGNPLHHRKEGRGWMIKLTVGCPVGYHVVMRAGMI
jgi:hypothetical protein